jgi:hypothetical protein
VRLPSFRRFPCGLVALLSIACSWSDSLSAQVAGDRSSSVNTEEVRTTRTTTAPTIDGRLDEAAWQAARPFGAFKQVEPVDGADPTEPTEIRVLFDDDALYVGARLFDSEARGIARQRSRRDGVVDADRFTLYLDPNHDHLTGVALTVTAAGVQRDTAISNDIVEDESWDAVWASAVSVDEGGWTVEMRVPFSQLRFPPGERPVWGINAARIVLRKHEVTWLSPVPRNQGALASRMAHLEGLPALRPPRHIEVRPYVSGRLEWIEPPRPGDPFNDGTRLRGAAGGDVKLGLASNLTLDATVNPDFGQVEVDPAVVNLTAFETFFPEKRPFFIEGSQAFATYGKSGAASNAYYFRPEPILFYSRRIGRVPQGFASADFVDRPASTTIFGAAKVTGRTSRGWTVSIVDALTAEESARTASGLVREHVEVEPFTNYVAGRAFKELGPRAGVGLIGTSTARRLDTAALDATLAATATVGGIDAHWFVDRRREWVVHGSLAGSRVSGSEAAIAVVQRASARYYQRPDAPHVRFDPSRRSLAGWMGDVALNRNSGNLLVNARLWGNSPGFEVNDLGFVTQTDRAGGHGLIVWRKLTPGRVFRSWQVTPGKWWTWNFGREPQGDGEQVAAALQFLNYWELDVTGLNSRDTLDDKLTRGGPTVIRPGIRQLQTVLVSDTRRVLGGRISASWQERNFGSWSNTFGGAIDYRPSPVVSLSVGPTVLDARTVAQYLRTVVDPLATATYGRRYVFGDLRQTEVSIESRLNVVLSPTVSLQAYVQPLVSVGQYDSVRELAARETYDFPRYGTDIGTVTPGPSARTLTIDPDGSGPAHPFVLPDPDFNVKSLRLNTILRWEWRPGSTFYFVWTESRRDDTHPGVFSFGRDVGDLLSANPDDVLMVKWTWWIAR